MPWLRVLGARGGAEGVYDAAASGRLVLLAGRERCLEHSLDVAQLLHPCRHHFEPLVDAPLDFATGRGPQKLGHVIQGEPVAWAARMNRTRYTSCSRFARAGLTIQNIDSLTAVPSRRYLWT